MTGQCDDSQLQGLLDLYRTEAAERIEATQALIYEFPEDARLHFMLGSTLIGDGRLIEGHASLSRAVEIAPDFAIARFQLGLFQLTSGEADNALDTWGRLDRLPEGHYLRCFVDGLRALIRDEFVQCAEHLRAGIALNTENAPLNTDMGLIIEKCEEIRSAGSASGEAPMTETALILQQFSQRTRPN
ncbi:MAG: hypothetical protein ABL889_04345 [Terricaulis sp.]